MNDDLKDKSIGQLVLELFIIIVFFVLAIFVITFVFNKIFIYFGDHTLDREYQNNLYLDEYNNMSSCYHVPCNKTFTNCRFNAQIETTYSCIKILHDCKKDFFPKPSCSFADYYTSYNCTSLVGQNMQVSFP